MKHALVNESNTAKTTVVETVSNQNSQFETSNNILFDETSSSHHMAYNEMADIPVQEVDAVALVQKNLAHLVEMHSRMSFMMREVRYLLKV